MEVWKPYGSYEVSNMGNVKGKFGKILKLLPNIDGYLQVHIYENGTNKFMRVHRLVAMCFIPNPENNSEIDHINRIKTDNRVENLRWVTRKENTNNTGNWKTNKLGLKHIYTDIKGTNEYWVIKIHSHKIRKCFRKSKYTLEQVLEERNKIYLEYNNVSE